MSINTITYSDKSDINTTATPTTNKITADDMNEIKSVVNSNANLTGDISTLSPSATDVVSAINSIATKTLPIVLFVGNATNNCTLNDSYTNYSRIDVYTNAGYTSFLPDKSNSCLISSVAYTDQLYQVYEQFLFSGTSVTKQYSGNYYGGTNHTQNATIYKIIGYK